MWFPTDGLLTPSGLVRLPRYFGVHVQLHVHFPIKINFILVMVWRGQKGFYPTLTFGGWRTPSDIVWTMNRYNWSTDNAREVFQHWKCIENWEKNWVKLGEAFIGFWPQWKDSFISGSRCLCQISSKSVKNCDRESVDTQTNRQRWHGWSYNLSHAML